MSYVQLAIMFLKLANLLVGWAKQSQALQAGEDQAIAQMSATILAETKSAKAVMEKIDALRGADVDVLLHQLESTDSNG